MLYIYTQYFMFVLFNVYLFSSYHFSKTFKQFWEWFIAFRSPMDISKHHPDFLKLELAEFVCTFLTFLHGELYSTYSNF